MQQRIYDIITGTLLVSYVQMKIIFVNCVYLTFNNIGWIFYAWNEIHNFEEEVKSYLRKVCKGSHYKEKRHCLNVHWLSLIVTDCHHPSFIILFILYCCKSHKVWRVSHYSTFSDNKYVDHFWMIWAARLAHQRSNH